MDGSRFADKLGTNYIPSAAEMQEITNLLVRPRAELSQISAEITRLSSLLDTLRSKRDSLHYAVTAHTELISPARRLPADIIRCIFVHCLPYTFKDVFGRTVPLRLSAICSFWRYIAITTPALWTRIYVHVRSCDPNTENIRQAAIQEWISGAGVLCLSISFSIGTYIPRNIALQCINTIAPLCRRWREIELDITPSVASIFSEISEDNLLELERFNLCFSAGHVLSPSENYLISFFRAPKLQRISLNRIRNLSAAPIRWRQVTKLSLQGSSFGEERGISAKQAILMLSQCPNLETCVLHLQISSTSESSTKLDLLYLNALQSLSISEHSDSDACELLKGLRLPALRHVAYYRDGSRVDDFKSLFVIPSVSTVPFTIETLRINPGTDIVLDSLRQCLQLVTSFKRLEIYRTLPSEELLCLMSTLSGTKLSLVPSLEAFQYHGSTGFSYETIVTFLRSRISMPCSMHVGRLRNVSLACIGVKTEDLDLEISSLSSSGEVEIDITYSVKTSRIIWSDSHFAKVKEFYV